MSSEYTITGGPYTLKELASKVKLPQVLLVTRGFYGATDKDTISGGDVIVAFFLKRVKGVTGIHKKRSFHIPLNSAMQFSPVPSEGVQDMYETVADVIESESPPAVVATVNMTQDAHGQVLRPGSVLFSKRPKNNLKTKLKGLAKKGDMATAEFTTTAGTKVHLPMDCAAGFSTQVEDIKLYLPELMAHLTLPVEVKCFAHQKSRHCKNLRSITLTKMSEETSITGGLRMEGDNVKNHQFDLSLDLPVQVACINLAKEKLQEDLYSRVKSTYESVDNRLTANWKVTISGDACDKAQQEFYSSVRADMAQEVVTVDVPERIYDEVAFVNTTAATPNTYKGVQSPASAGVPKQAPPPRPPHCLDDSKDESYMRFMRTAPAPLPHSSFAPPLVLPGRSQAMYAAIQPNTSHPANVYASLVHDRPAPPKPSPKPTPQPALLKASNTQPLQVLGRPTQLPPAPNSKPALRKADTQPLQVLDRPTQLPPPPPPKPALHKKANMQPQLSVSQKQAEGSNPGPGPVSEEDNIKFLHTLSCNDIICLLDSMELPQYIDCFMKEHIDGELLACMTEHELQEVGITSSLHRKRFIKVITGRHSAEQLLEYGNPYAAIR